MGVRFYNILLIFSFLTEMFIKKPRKKLKKAKITLYANNSDRNPGIFPKENWCFTMDVPRNQLRKNT
jgi:hypothetical protein